MTYISSCLSQKQLAEKFAFTNHSSRSSVANSSSATSAHIVRDMLTQIMNDQVFMKEQLLRLNAVHSSSSAAKSASSSSASSSPTVVDDVLTDDEFVELITTTMPTTLLRMTVVVMMMMMMTTSAVRMMTMM
jgi:hypothetical protein